MSLTKYRAFVTVAELGSLTRAAKSMGYSQPGIGKMIDSLESELNLPLFTRNGTSIELNDNGKIIYVYLKDILKREEEMKNVANSINGLITGNVRIGALNSIILDFIPQLLMAYSSAYANIQINLDQQSYQEVIESLQNGTIDIGFTSEFNVKGLEFIPLFRDPCRLIVNKNHAFASCESIPISALNGCEMIMVPAGGDDVIAAVKKRKQFTPVAKSYIHSDATALAMVSANFGAYIISELQCRHLPDTIQKVAFEESVYRTMGIAVKSSKKASPAVKEMIKIARRIAEKEEFQY